MGEAPSPLSSPFWHPFSATVISLAYAQLFSMPCDKHENMITQNLHEGEKLLLKISVTFLQTLSKNMSQDHRPLKSIAK